jgi:DNA-binding XRE family transcriptional regulator
MTIGQAIRHLRESNGMTQDDLAKVLGCTNKAVSSWEVGAKTPRMGTIEKIASHFGAHF